jgi:hypothetical protein
MLQEGTCARGENSLWCCAEGCRWEQHLLVDLLRPSARLTRRAECAGHWRELCCCRATAGVKKGVAAWGVACRAAVLFPHIDVLVVRPPYDSLLQAEPHSSLTAKTNA